MKKLFVLGFALLSVLSAAAQELSVKSFEAKVTDLAAKVDPVLDLNGNPCALIRVQIACKGCTFSGNIVGRPQEKPGEYLVYVPAGTRRLKIAHPDFLPLTYEFNLKIEKNCTYELRITLPQNTAAIPELNSQFLVLTVAPADAIVLVNDVLQTTEGGVLSKELPYGEHTYRVEAPMYHPRRGTFTVAESGKTELAVALDPAFGFLAVTSAPESGARVLVDGKQVGTTPYKSDRMASGTYQVQVLKEGYYPQMEPVEIADNRTAALNLSLKASFAAITLQAANPEAEIRVSGKLYGKGSWTGRLEAGTYSVESRCEGYEPALQSVEVEAGRPQTIRLAAQTPIYGILKVSSTPVGAAVKLDGKPLGETPLLTNKVLAGVHRLEVTKNGMVPFTREVRIVKGQTAEVAVALLSVYGTVAVQSVPSGAVVRIDGRERGRTPFTSGNLSEGEHTVEVVSAGYAPKRQTVRIAKNQQAKISVTLEKEDVLYNKALAAFKAGKTQTGLALLTQAAEAGNAAAQYDLGDRYYHGKGVKQDYTKGHYYWWMAAQNGHEAAKKYIEDTPQRYRKIGNIGQKKFTYYEYDGFSFGGSTRCSDNSQPFSEGLACVEIAYSTYGPRPKYIDSRCNVIFNNLYLPSSKSYRQIRKGTSFKNGVAQVRLDNGNIYYINHKGDILPYESIISVDEGTNIVKKDGKYGLKDRNMRTILPLEYDKIDKLGAVLKNGKYGKIDLSNGELIFPNMYDEIASASTSENLYKVKKDGMWGVVDLKGDVIIPIEYDEIRNDKDGWIIIQNSSWGFVNSAGKQILEPVYENIISNSAGFFIQKKNGWGLADAEGRIIIPMEYQTIGLHLSDFNIVKVQKYSYFHGLLAVDGSVIVRCDFYLIDYQGVANAEKKGIQVRNFSSDNARWGLVDLAGNVIIPCKYKTAWKMTDEVRAKAMAAYAKKYPEKYAAHLAAAKRLRELGVKE